MPAMIDLQDQAVATLRKVLPMGRSGDNAYRAAERRFSNGMALLGFQWEDQTRVAAWADCIDMAKLENAAASK